MKLIVKKTTVVKTVCAIIFLIVCALGWTAVYKQSQSEDKILRLTGESEKDIQTINSSGGNRLHCGCIGKCTCGDEQEDDEMIRKGIAEEVGDTDDKDWSSVLVDARQRTRVIYDEQIKIDIAYKPIAEIKELRKRIMYEYRLWHTFRKQISDDQLETNKEVFSNYTENISTTATRQRLLEQQVGLDYDIDNQEYKEKTNE